MFLTRQWAVLLQEIDKYISAEEISKYVIDSESQTSHCWIKRLQICK